LIGETGNSLNIGGAKVDLIGEVDARNDAVVEASPSTADHMK
jgi:hypothetical protein